MAYHSSHLTEIALTGANIAVDATKYHHTAIKEVILAAKSVGGHVTVLNACNYHSSITKELALAGAKNVTIYLTDAH